MLKNLISVHMKDTHLKRAHKLCLLLSSWLIISLLWVSAAWAEGRIAVLEVQVNKHKGVSALNPFEARALTDELRSLALALNTYDVLTKENMTVLLPPETKLEDCTGECEVEIGRKLGVTYIITAEVGRISGEIDLLVRLYDTQTGLLINQLNLTGKDALSLRSSIKSEGRRLFSKLALRDVASTKLDTLLYLTLRPAQLQLSIDSKPIILSDLQREGEGYLLPVVPEVKHKLVASLPGYIDAREEVFVSEGRVETINIELAQRLKPTDDQRCDPARDRKCEANLFVYTTPPGAAIYVDGALYKEAGSAQASFTESENPDTPNLGMKRIKVTPGPHLIEARIPRFLPARREVNLKRGAFDNSTLRERPLTLTPNYGELRVEASPSEAMIEVNGELVSKTSTWRDAEMKVGAHKLKVFAPKHLPHEQLVLVTRGQTKTVPIKLTPNYSNLIIRPRGPDGSSVVGARVQLDQDRRTAQRVDQTGVVRFAQVEYGKHTLQVSHHLYDPFTLQFEAQTGGREVRLPINLKARYGLVSMRSASNVPARVYLENGALLGELPLTQVKIPRGRQELRVQPLNTERYSPLDLNVTLATLESKDLGNVVLEPRMGEVMITSKPYGATVKVDGEVKGVTPLKLELFQGKHVLNVSLREYDTFKQQFRVTEGELLDLDVNLGQNPTVKVICSPSEAMVWVNGVPRGRSPQRYSARPSRWLVKCALGDAEVSKSVQLQMGESKTLSLTISSDHINKLKARGEVMKTIGWSLLGASALTALGSGLSYGVFQQGALEEREASYQRFVLASPLEESAARQALLEADQSAVTWGQVSVGTLVTSLITGAAGGLTLWLAPDVSASSRSPKSSQSSNASSLKKRAQQAQDQLKEPKP